MRRLAPLVPPASLAALLLAVVLLPPGMARPAAGAKAAAAQREPRSGPAVGSGGAPAGEPTPLPESYGLVATWDTAIPTGHLLFHPAGIAVDAQGTVVVAETGNHRLTRASATGQKPYSLQPNEPPEHLGGPGSLPGAFTAPEDLAVTAAGDRIYVADTGNRRVQVLAPSGRVLGTWPEIGEPRGIALGPGRAPDGGVIADGRVFVADTAGRRVRVFDPDGGWLADWTAGGTLRTPLGLTVTPSGDLAVADAGLQRVLWLDADGSEGPAGAAVGALNLDNGAGPGGSPSDVGVNTDGEVFVAVARGVLRFRPTSPGGRGEVPPGSGVAAALGYASLLPALAARPCGGACRPLGQDCVTIAVERASHEGIQRLDLRPGVGLFITYASELRWGDRVVVYPALKPAGGISLPEYNNVNANWVWPKPCRDYPGPETRHATDPERIDTGPAPFEAIALDTPGWLRTWRADGRWQDGLHPMPAVAGLDLALDRMRPPNVVVITGNQLVPVGPQCLLGLNQSPYPPGACQAPPVDALDRGLLLRRERTNECRRAEPIPWRAGPGPCIPEDRWWHLATAFGPAGAVALDSGGRRAILRLVLGAQAGRLVAGISLGAGTEPFRSFVDLDQDANDQLWVLARDGAVRLFDDRGRDRGEMRLVGPAAGRAESLSVAPDGRFFVLTGDGWLLKYAPEEGPAPSATPTRPVTPGPTPRPTRTLSRPSATARPSLPARALPLAAWRVADLAGPGRYRDLAVDAGGRVLVTDGDHDRVLVFAPGPATPSATAPPPPGLGPCRFTPDKVAAPARLPLGDTTELTLGLAGGCGSRHEALDVVAVIDASCQMAGERLARAREALLALVDAMTQPRDRLGFVTFLEGQGDARVLVPLTADRERLRAAARAFDSDCHIVQQCLDLDFHDLGYIRSFLYPYGCKTEGRIADGLRGGREALFGPAARDEAGKALILLSPSLNDSQHILATLSMDPDTFEPPFSPGEQRRWNQDLGGAGPVRLPVTDRENSLWEGWRLREAGVRVLTTGVGVDAFGAGHPPDEGLLAALAWPADGYRPAAAPADLVEVLAADGRELSARVLMQRLVITDRIPANMRYLPGSAQPPAELLADGGRPDGALRWTFDRVPLAGPPALRYRLEPLEPGHWPTNREAWADYVDGLGHAGRSVFPVPEVEVIGPTPSEEPTSVPASPTVTPSAPPGPTATPPTATPSTPPGPSATPWPSASPTTPARPAPRRRLYLPLVQRWACQPGPRPVDVALLIDTSSSMTGAKLAAAQRAAGIFAGLLDLRPGRDRAAVLGFDAEARLLQPLSARRAEVLAGLAALHTAAGTRIDLGLAAAVAELAGVRRRPEADRAIVLLTDGLPLPGTEAAAVAEGGRARAAGIATWAIGLGADADPALLAQIAGGAERVRLAPGPGELEAVYRQVAGGIVCR